MASKAGSPEVNVRQRVALSGAEVLWTRVDAVMTGVHPRLVESKMQISGLKIEDAINALCPWSGKPIAADSLTRYRGAVVGFCNPGCRDKFERAVTMFDAALLDLGLDRHADNKTL